MNGDTLKIELNCSKSGMKAEMLKAVQCCSCPKSDDIKTEEFFSVTSCAPASKVKQNRFKLMFFLCNNYYFRVVLMFH